MRVDGVADLIVATDVGRLDVEAELPQRVLVAREHLLLGVGLPAVVVGERGVDLRAGDGGVLREDPGGDAEEALLVRLRLRFGHGLDLESIAPTEDSEAARAPRRGARVRPTGTVETMKTAAELTFEKVRFDLESMKLGKTTLAQDQMIDSFGARKPRRGSPSRSSGEGATAGRGLARKRSRRW